MPCRPTRHIHSCVSLIWQLLLHSWRVFKSDRRRRPRDLLVAGISVSVCACVCASTNCSTSCASGLVWWWCTVVPVSAARNLTRKWATGTADSAPQPDVDAGLPCKVLAGRFVYGGVLFCYYCAVAVNGSSCDGYRSILANTKQFGGDRMGSTPVAVSSPRGPSVLECCSTTAATTSRRR